MLYLEPFLIYPQELETTWATMEFMMDKHPRTGVMLIRTSEEMIETLEENQVIYLGSKLCNTLFILHYYKLLKYLFHHILSLCVHFQSLT